MSTDPKLHPVMDPHYFDEELDLDILVEIFKFTRKVAGTGAFKLVSVAEVAPGANVTSDEDIRGECRSDVIAQLRLLMATQTT